VRSACNFLCGHTARITPLPRITPLLALQPQQALCNLCSVVVELVVTMRVALTASLLLVLAVCNGARYRSASPGPWVTPTVGEPWPKPQQLVNYEGYVVVRPTAFTFEVRKLFNMTSFIICAIKGKAGPVTGREGS
jgi:hypothetical protein